jgi:hypothetical protein
MDLVSLVLSSIIGGLLSTVFLESIRVWNLESVRV